MLNSLEFSISLQPNDSKTPMAETCLIWDSRYPPCIAKVDCVMQYCFQLQTL